MKYLIHWKGWGDEADTWECEEDFVTDTTRTTLKVYWKTWEKDFVDRGESETVIKDLQGELECPHFREEPERLYRKRCETFLVT